MISVLYTIILITNFKLIEMCIKSSPSGRVGVGLLGLLEPADPVPVVAFVAVHDDVIFSEVQAERVAAPWVST